MAELTAEQIMAKASHKLYPRAEKETAEGAAWVFYNKDLFNKYFYTLPPLGEREVRLRVLYTSVGKLDIEIGRERHGFHPKPVCPGQEAVGEIQAVGSAAKRFKVGDRVLVSRLRDSCGKCEYCTNGQAAFCSKMEAQDKELAGVHFGSFATHINVPETFLIKLSEKADPKTIAPVVGSGAAAFLPMREHLKKGMRVGVVGVGGVGHLAIQVGAKMGLQIDAFTSGDDPQKEAFITELGANEVFYWKEKGSFSNLKGRFDALVYTLPVNLEAEVMDNFVGLLKPKGKLILIGTPALSQKLRVSFLPLIEKKISILGSTVEGIQDLRETLRFFEENGIRVVAEEFAFDDFPRAVESVEFGHPRFKCIVNVDAYSQFFVPHSK